jgi:DNA polymerase III psi subunit
MTIGHFDSYPRYQIIEQPESMGHSTDLSAHPTTIVLCKSHDLTEENKTLLAKILKAVGETLETVQFVSVDQNGQHHLNQIIVDGHTRVLLSFEVNLNNNGLNIHQRLYHIIMIGELSILISESLTTLTQKKEAKMKLWTELQKLYPQQS